MRAKKEKKILQIPVESPDTTRLKARESPLSLPIERRDCSLHEWGSWRKTEPIDHSRSLRPAM